MSLLTGVGLFSWAQMQSVPGPTSFELAPVQDNDYSAEVKRKRQSALLEKVAGERSIFIPVSDADGKYPLVDIFTNQIGIEAFVAIQARKALEAKAVHPLKKSKGVPIELIGISLEGEGNAKVKIFFEGNGWRLPAKKSLLVETLLSGKLRPVDVEWSPVLESTDKIDVSGKVGLQYDPYQDRFLITEVKAKLIATRPGYPPKEAPITFQNIYSHKLGLP